MSLSLRKVLFGIGSGAILGVALAHSVRADQPAPPPTPPAPETVAPKAAAPVPAVPQPTPHDVEAWIRDAQKRHQQDVKRMFEAMNATLPPQFPRFSAPVFPLPNEFPDAPREIVEKPNYRSVTTNSNSASSYSLSGDRLTAKISETGVNASLSGRIVNGKLILDRIELGEPTARQVFGALEQVPATARTAIQRQILQWEQELTVQPGF